MTIGIDIRILGSQYGGIAEYTERIVGELIWQAPEHQFKLFYSSLRRPLPNFPWLKAPNVQLCRFYIPNNVLFTANRVCDWPCIDELIDGVDVFFSPHFFIAPLSSKCRRVTTFHDLSFERFPEFFTLGKRLWHTVQMNPANQARFSDRIIADSESTKSDLVSCYHIDSVNISVIYPGLHMERPSEKNLLQFKKQHRLPDRFIFVLSTLEPRKNTEGVVQAFNLLKGRPGFDDVKLLIGGADGWLIDSLRQKIEESPYASDIQRLGFVSSLDKPHYYSLASVLAYPSFFEGFGFPVIEAMACGTPVLTSPNSSMPEVGGNGAFYVDPYNVNDIAEGLDILLGNAEIRRQCVEEGHIQAVKFSWQTAARATLDILLG